MCIAVHVAGAPLHACRQSCVLSYRSSDEEGRFVRRGSVGRWRERLTEEQIRLVDRYAGRVLGMMGYPTGASIPKRTNDAVMARAEERVQATD